MKVLALGGPDPPPSMKVLELGGPDPPPSMKVLALGGLQTPSHTMASHTMASRAMASYEWNGSPRGRGGVATSHSQSAPGDGAPQGVGSHHPALVPRVGMAHPGGVGSQFTGRSPITVRSTHCAAADAAVRRPVRRRCRRHNHPDPLGTF